MLMNNGTAFHFETLEEMHKWNVNPFFRVVYRQSGNGFMKKLHHTIKAMLKRGYISPIKAEFWYNMLSQSKQAEELMSQ